MILQSLTRYYQHLLEQPDSNLAPYGYSPEKISYEILLALDGSITAVQPTLDTSGKKPQPRRITVPQPETRTAGLRPNFLWDKTSSVLGVSATLTSDKRRVGHTGVSTGRLRWCLLLYKKTTQL